MMTGMQSIPQMGMQPTMSWPMGMMNKVAAAGVPPFPSTQDLGFSFGTHLQMNNVDPSQQALAFQEQGSHVNQVFDRFMHSEVAGHPNGFTQQNATSGDAQIPFASCNELWIKMSESRANAGAAP